MSLKPPARLTPGGMAPDLMAKHRICTSEVAPSSVSWAVMVNLRVTELCVTVKLSILTMPAAAAFSASTHCRRRLTPAQEGLIPDMLAPRELQHCRRMIEAPVRAFL